MLTREEKAWVRKVQKLLDACPSDRLGFYTIGDPDIIIYDRSREREIEADQEKHQDDFCCAVSRLDCGLGQLDMPAAVHSTSG